MSNHQSNLQTIRGYQLRERIGAGGFGEVYRAYQAVVEREVAIKVILPVYANHPDFIRSFESEARIITRLEHPHIVPLYDYWREPDGAYLVMRWLPGGNLRQSLQETPWDPPRASRMLDQIASALAIAHNRGVVHRDLKPENILLDSGFFRPSHHVLPCGAARPGLLPPPTHIPANCGA
ncbi:MAG: serine/threonine-protein kinase [Anaerolineales bacterium]|jgi:serine/threonine protein kinase